jgi:hypothetical protein
MNAMTEEKLAELSARFRLGLQNNVYLFDRHAFRKHSPDQATRSVVNASLWDVMSTGLSRYPHELVTEKAEELKGAFYPLLEDTEFIDAITYSPNSTNKVQRRFELAGRMFKEVFGDYTS